MNLSWSKKINKPKELWKALKSMGLTSKAASVSNICLKVDKEIVFNNTKNCSIFKNFISNPAQKLSTSPNVFTESTVASYYENIKSKDLIFLFSETF